MRMGKTGNGIDNDYGGGGGGVGSGDIQPTISTNLIVKIQSKK